MLLVMNFRINLHLNHFQICFLNSLVNLENLPWTLCLLCYGYLTDSQNQSPYPKLWRMTLWSTRASQKFVQILCLSPISIFFIGHRQSWTIVDGDSTPYGNISSLWDSPPKLDCQTRLLEQSTEYDHTETWLKNCYNTLKTDEWVREQMSHWVKEPYYRTWLLDKYQ